MPCYHTSMTAQVIILDRFRHSVVNELPAGIENARDDDRDVSQGTEHARPHLALAHHAASLGDLNEVTRILNKVQRAFAFEPEQKTG